MATQAQAQDMLGIYKKLVMVQEALKAPKDSFNGFGGYAYRSAESILGKVKPLLAQYGLVILCNDEIVQVSERFYVKSTATLVDADTGATVSTSAFARESLDRKGVSDSAMNTGSSSSYARKYCLCGLLGISDSTDDPDSRAARGPQNGPPQGQAPRGQQQRPQNGQGRPQGQPQGQRQMQQQRPIQGQPQPVQQQKPTSDPMEDLKAGVRTRNLANKIQEVINRNPERQLLQQIKDIYKVNGLDEMTEQQAQKCLMTLERCEKAWIQAAQAKAKEGGAA